MSSQKKPRALRPKDLFPKWFGLQESERIVEDERLALAMKLSADPAIFFRQIVGFEPTDYQKNFIKLFMKNQFVAARWCRQSGKSYIISALLLWYAVIHSDSYVGVVGPSWRQAKLIIRRLNYFARKLPPAMVLKGMKTKVLFTNGSVIESFPCSPETIRGPTLDLVYIDEFNFVPEDQDLYDSVLFTLSATGGKFVCSSTPWNTDSVFYKIFNHRDYRDFKTSHVTYDEATEPNGPLKKSLVDKIKRQLQEDPWRWKREMEAEWAEDESVWLSQSLITKCIGTSKSCGSDLAPFGIEKNRQGEFYVGLDFGKHGDYTALAIIERVGERYFLRFLKVWPLETPYASVIGFVKQLQDRWESFVKIRADQTGIGDYIVEDMKNGGINNVEGVTFTLPRKQEMASLLKQRMVDSKFFYPYVTWEKPYPGQLVAELNVERFELRKDGTITFNHPQGTHDDVFWAVALALYATVEMKPFDLEAFKFG